MQPDLFPTPPKDDGEPRCGNCVHRAGAVDRPMSYCSPRGLRGAQEPPCSQWFGREQLRLSLLRRPK